MVERSHPVCVWWPHVREREGVKAKSKGVNEEEGLLCIYRGRGEEVGPPCATP
jgi:hypothetical protein